MSKKEVLIIGAGVSGLSCGVLLLQEGYKVHIAAKDLPPNTTSDVAAAFWMPYLSSPHEKVMKWARDTLTYLKENVVSDPESGCVFRDVLEIYRNKVDKPSWADAVDSWKRPKQNDMPEGFVDGHQTEAILMDSSFYMKWLVNRFNKLGGTLEKREIDDINLELNEDKIVVNCSGLGSRKLLGDKKLFPVRGQVVRIKHNGFKNVVADDTDPNEMTVIIPRIKDIIIGGTIQANDWNLKIDPRDTEGIIKRAGAFYSEFSDVEILEEKVGLRPARDEVRLEIEKRKNGSIVHNYGHGGSGYTLSWGCAQEVVKLVAQLNT